MKRTMLYPSLLAVSCSVNAAKYPVLIESSPEKTGFNVERLNQIDRWTSQQADVGYPSVNLLIIKDNQVVYRKAWGAAKKHDGSVLVEQSVKATTGTLYNLASNTKMYATNFTLQKPTSEGKPYPDDRTAKYIPGSADNSNDTIKGKNTLWISDLLHYGGGFPADPQYSDKTVVSALYSQGKGQMLKMIKRTSLEYQPGSKHIYSDIGYMLLGFIVKSVTGQPLDRYIEESTCRPLGLTHTVFNPLLKGFKPQQIAATELNGNTRDGMIRFLNIRTSALRGQMHDEKAFYSMSGVSGHAGLFFNTGDTAVLMQTMLNGGGYGDVQLFNTETMKMFTTGSKKDAAFGLGWRVNGNATMTPTFGTLASPQTYGHTSRTGTVTIIDPVNHIMTVILSSEPHLPVADPQKNPNMFKSGQSPITTYGWIVDQVYAALKQK